MPNYSSRLFPSVIQLALDHLHWIQLHFLRRKL